MILSRGYAIRPAEIPLAMLYVNGINTITRNAGKPSVQSSKSMLRMAPNMRAPTMIRTGDVAAEPRIPMEPRISKLGKVRLL